MDSLQTTIKSSTLSNPNPQDVWMYIAIAEFIVIACMCVLFILRHIRKNEKGDIKSKILKEGEIDFVNTINSSFKAKSLYDELKKSCHPDKFSKDEELNAKATEIFALLVKHKHDYATLCKLKERSRKELGIKF